MKAILTIVAAITSTMTNPALAQDGTCGLTQTCTVAGARCVDGSCRLNLPSMLFPTDDTLDTVELMEPADRAVVDSAPSFRWIYPTGTDLLAVAVFKEPPQFVASVGAQIQNQENLAWIWSSNADGMGPGTTAAFYNGGHQYKVDNGICVAVSAPPLIPGTHDWAAWGWSGGMLKSRSEVRTLSVGSEQVTGKHCSSDANCDPAAGGRCYPGKFFCVVGCASNADCFAGETCDTSPSAQHSWGFCRRSATCACGSDETCDSETNICYRGTRVGNTAGCECDGDDPARTPSQSVSNLCAPMLGLTLFVARRRRSRRSSRT